MLSFYLCGESEKQTAVSEDAVFQSAEPSAEQRSAPSLQHRAAEEESE